MEPPVPADFHTSYGVTHQSLWQSFRCCQRAPKPTLQGGLAWVLGLLSMGSSVVHLFYPEQLHGALPPYVPFSFMLIGMVGFFQSTAGLGLLLPALRRPAGWLLTLVVIVAFPANAHLFFDAFYNAETWRFVLMALWTPCQLVLIVMIYIASAPWTRPHRKEVRGSTSIDEAAIAVALVPAFV